MKKLDSHIDEVLGVVNFKKTQQLTRIIKEYVEMLFSWHDFHNIIGTRDPIYFIKREVHDSLAISNYLPNGKLVDIGTGGGVPGVLIAMIKKESHLFLLDRKEKSTRFLEQVKLKLNIENITIINQSFEEFKGGENIEAIILKGFSNKVISKMAYHEKISYIIEKIKQNIGENLPVYFLTGSKVLGLESPQIYKPKDDQKKFIVTEINSPFFKEKRYLLESQS